MTDMIQSEAGHARPPDGADSRPAVTVDIARYQALLDGEDLTDDQKRQFLETLWQIIVQFVDLGFGVHPLQAVQKDGEDGSISLEDALARMVDLDSSRKTQVDRIGPAHARSARMKEESC